MISPKTELFVTKVDQHIRCFILGFDSELIAWGAINPDRDQRMLQLLLKYTHFKETSQPMVGRPYISEETNRSLLLRAWSTFAKPKSYVMSTKGQAPASRGVVTFHSDRENLSAASWNLNGTLIGYTTIAKTDSQFVFLTDNWSLQKDHSTLLDRFHQLRRELLAKGYLAILADDGGPLSKEQLQLLGFVKSPQIPVFRQSDVAPPLLK